MSERTAVIDNYDLNSIEGFEVDQIRPDQIPDKVINTVQLALADGEVYDDMKYVKKMIPIKAHFFAPDRSLYEVARDNVLYALNSDEITMMQFEQAGSQRRYFGVYETVQFEYKGQGLCLATINYRATNPFGMKIDETTFYEGVITDELNFTADSYGNVYALPKVSAIVNLIDDENTERTMTITMSQGVRTYNIQITRVWNATDTVVIDAEKQRVTVNGLKQKYTGRFPRLFKTNTLRFNMLEAAFFEVALKVKYNERYL